MTFCIELGRKEVMFQIGTVIDDKYKILKEIGRGRMSVVYLAINEKANKQWAIKAITKKGMLDFVQVQQRVVEDSWFFKKLSHPNLPSIVDIIETEEFYIVIMDYIQGKTLDKVLEENGVPLESDVISWTNQLCDALHYLHTRTPAIICGNIKPHNIILKPDGNVVLMNFWIDIERKEKIFSDTTCLGTSGYLAPEQLGNALIDERTDVYGLGATVYSLLTGHSLYKAPYRMLSIHEINPNVSRNLEMVILKCMERNPMDRYQSMVELMHNLQHQDCASSFSYRRKIKFFRVIRHYMNKQTEKTTIDSVKNVRFSAVAPSNFVRGEYTMIDIIMYEDKYRYIVLQSKLDNTFTETLTGYFSIKDKTVVRICLSSPDVEILDNVEVYTWCGKYLKFRFAVFLPEDNTKKQLIFYAKVYFDDIIATNIKFSARTSSIWKQKIKVSRKDIFSAFLSYANQDRNHVILIVQGMKKARPDLDIFYDVDRLRSGDYWEEAIKTEIKDRDVLFLCWSHFARESKWVDFEWRYALEKKGIEAIEPIPLELPAICPPPPELASKHFNDRELYYMENKV